jgi:hypothetical protein
LEQIVKSLTPVALLVAGAVVSVLAAAFMIGSDAALAPSSFGTSSDLGQAGRWLLFIGGVCVLAAVCTAGWELVLRSAWVPGAEIAAAALGGLLFVIGLLASAASNGSSNGGSATGAVGIGIWALLVLSRAARVSLTEQGPAGEHPAQAPASQAGSATEGGQGRRADLWLAAAIGLFILAIGYGFTPSSSEGLAIAAGLLQAIGVAVLAGSVAVARSRGLLRARPLPVDPVLIGLGLLAVSFFASAIVAGLNFDTLSALGAGLAIVTAIELAGIAALGVAAWGKLRELYK